MYKQILKLISFYTNIVLFHMPNRSSLEIERVYNVKTIYSLEVPKNTLEITFATFGIFNLTKQRGSVLLCIIIHRSNYSTIIFATTNLSTFGIFNLINQRVSVQLCRQTDNIEVITVQSYLILLISAVQ